MQLTFQTKTLEKEEGIRNKSGIRLLRQKNIESKFECNFDE